MTTLGDTVVHLSKLANYPRRNQRGCIRVTEFVRKREDLLRQGPTLKSAQEILHGCLCAWGYDADQVLLAITKIIDKHGVNVRVTK